MILVNNPGSWDHVYPQLLHAEWHGWTLTDLIFPFFLFIVGVAMTFSSRMKPGTGDRRAVYARILRRSAIIFALGLLLNAVSTYGPFDLRVAGVLQRIAVVYLATSLIILNTSRRGQVAWFVGLLLGYWAVMRLVTVPGCITGAFTPDCNLASWIDRLYLPGRMWPGMYDPEGMLSTLPAIATALLGVFTGYWIRSGRERSEIAAGMFTAGWLLIGVGLIWGLAFPINKNLWTSSYVLFTGGAALQALAFCYWLIDGLGYRRWAAPAIVLGVNAIAVYVLSSLMAKALYLIPVGSGADTVTLKQWVWEHFFAPMGNLDFASLLFAVSYLALWWGLMAVLYRRNIFITI